ncbi:Uncharacterised protein [Mycolicibacterium aurum]|uniref:Uncharacterized protein n=1 Tax=Mycolicibacterium aurum TaxID=1791 RepID=A0A3S4RKB7_MYCAU|nr:Uncharacterised protein [Mycolicibacterium aurum]
MFGRRPDANPTVAAGDLQVSLRAAENSSGLDKFVERNILTQPPVVAKDIEDSSKLEMHARTCGGQIPIQFRIRTARPDQRRRQGRDPFEHLHVHHGAGIYCFRMIVDGQQCYDVLLPADAESGAFEGGNHQSGFGRVAADGFDGHPGTVAIFATVVRK